MRTKQDGDTGTSKKSDTVRVNFDLDREEYTKLKVHAAMTNQSISDVLRGLIAKLAFGSK